jgi:hypothetical protein
VHVIPSAICAIIERFSKPLSGAEASNRCDSTPLQIMKHATHMWSRSCYQAMPVVKCRVNTSHPFV